MLLWSQVSSSTILRANLGFIYNFSHSKIDRSTGCQTSFSQERIAFTKPSIDHPPSHTFHVGIPSQPHKEQRSSSPQCFLQKGCALRSSSEHSPYSHLNTENSLLLWCPWAQVTAAKPQCCAVQPPLLNLHPSAAKGKGILTSQLAPHTQRHWEESCW